MAKQSWIAPEGVEHDVLGVPKKFYPISVKTLTQVSKIAKPLLKALSTLFTGVGQEIGGRRVQKHLKTNDTNGAESIEEFEPITSELALTKIRERDRAIDELVDALSNEQNAMIVLRVVMDCMRDDFSRPITDQAIKAFYEEVDARALRDMILGVSQANVEVLGPLGARLAEALRGRQSSVQGSDEPAPVPVESQPLNGAPT